MTNQRLKQLITIFCLSLFTLVIAQENQLSYLSQKLALENSVKERVTTALEKLLDDVKFVVDVKAEIEFTPIEQTRTIIGTPQETQIQPTTTSAGQPTGTTPEAAPVQVEGEISQPGRTSSELSLPLPGFEVPPSAIQPKAKTPEQKQLSAPPQSKPAETVTPTTAPTTQPNVSTSIQKTTIPVPIVKKQEINVILEDGVSPELIENVRQIVAVASHYDRVRGDIISIMTANFKKTPGKDPTETIILKNIAEKIDDIEKRQSQSEYNARLEQQKQTERQIIARDSLKIDELKKQILELQTRLSAPQTSEEQRVITEQTSAREIELANLREQLKESNRRLQELELSSLETTPPSMFGIRNNEMWYVIILAAVLFLALLIVLLINHRKQQKRQELEWGYGSKIPMGPRPPQPILNRQPEDIVKPQPPAQPPIQPAPVAPPAQAPQPVAPTTPPVDLENQKEELKSMRQSVISMTVGQPDTASRIINAWMSQEVQQTESETES
jgi:hypothetical protein